MRTGSRTTPAKYDRIGSEYLFELLSEVCGELRLPSDDILVKHRSIALHIKGQFRADLRKNDQGLVQRIGIAELVEHVRILWRDLGDDDRGFGNVALDVCQNRRWACDFVDADGVEALGLSCGSNHLVPDAVKGCGELRGDESAGRGRSDLNVFECDGRLTRCDDGDLSPDRFIGQDNLHDTQAHTSPVYVQAPGPELFSAGAASYMLTLIEGTRMWLDTMATRPDRERFERVHQVLHA